MPAEGPGHSFTMRDGTVLPAREVARGIYLIMNDEPRRIFDKIWKFLEAEIPTDRWPQFEAAFLEKEAIVFGGAALRVLITTKNNDERYEPLLWEFEEYLFPAAGPTEEGQKKLDALRSAMGDIQTLSVNPQLTWAYDWFLELGHDETNPDTLMMFIQMFSVGTHALRKLLKETIPR